MPTHNETQFPARAPQGGQHTSARKYTSRQSQAKAYETTRPTNRYQQSRGAQRDAKWHARYDDCSHLHTQQPASISQSDQCKHHYLDGNVPPPHASVALTSNVEAIRMEQRAAIAAARKAHTAQIQAEAEKIQGDKKIRSIQLQVFVHARYVLLLAALFDLAHYNDRPTPCAWGGCQAVLNSWALLEKHLLHCHLNTLPSGCETDAQDPMACQWKGCTETFANRQVCYRHCLVGHMSDFSARCPFGAFRPVCG
jgi:hypothetical protein